MNHSQSTTNQKQGTTMIELLIYAAIFSYVLLLVGNLLFTFLSFWQHSRSRQAVVSNISRVNDYLSRDIKQAKAITVPADDQFAAGLIIETDSGQITYATAGGKLMRNGEPLTDEQVNFDLAKAGLGFRLAGGLVDYRYQLSSLMIPLSGVSFSRLVKGSYFLNNLP